MQLVMAAAQIRAREHLQMLKLLVIMQLQDQALPQTPNTIHNVACAPFQAITFGDALLPCSSSLQPLWHLTTFKSMHRTHQQLKLRHSRDLSPSFCTSCSLTLFYPATFLVDSLDLSQVMYPFVKSVDTFVPCRVHKCLVVCMDLFLARPMMHGGSHTRPESAQTRHTTILATNSAPYTRLITTSALAQQSQHRNANPAPAR